MMRPSSLARWMLVLPLTTLSCASNQAGAREEGANLVLAFTGTLGKAVNCPKEAVDKILAMSKSGSVQ